MPDLRTSSAVESSIAGASTTMPPSCRESRWLIADMNSGEPSLWKPSDFTVPINDDLGAAIYTCV